MDRRPRRRQEDLSAPTFWSGMPWYVRAIGMIGVPSAALLFVLYYVVPPIGAMPRIEQKLDHHIKLQDQEMSEDRIHRAKMETWSRMTCYFLAKTDDQRDGCLRVQ